MAALSTAAGSQPAVKLVALCGSLRRNSTNRGLIRAASEIAKESIQGLEIEYVDISPLPMLNTDLEADGTFPPVVEAFRRKILEADAVLFASPEYNYSVTVIMREMIPGGLKTRNIHILIPLLILGGPKHRTFTLQINHSLNALDWASRPPNVWGDKAAAIVSSSGGSGGARSQYHLRQIGVFLNLHFINKPEFFLNGHQPPAKFNTNGDLIDAEVRDKLKTVLLALLAFSLRLRTTSPIN